MKNIFRIFKNDLKSIGKNLIVFIVIIGISILPALYAWFNIAANWEPYSNTKGLQFAVSTKDKGYSYSALSINAGDKIVSNLKENDKMGWDFVSEDDAFDGVNSGKYYAAVIIPENFSECLFSLTTGKFQQATMQYYVNEKINAIAPKITDKGIETIEESVNSTYVSTVTKFVATALNVTNKALDKTAGSSTKNLQGTLTKVKDDIDGFKVTIDSLAATLDSIDETVQKNKELLPTVQQKLNDAGVFTSDIKNSISKTENTALQITYSIESVINSTQNFTNELSDKADEALAQLETNTTVGAEKLRKIISVCDRIIDVNNRIFDILGKIQDNLGVDCSKPMNKLNDANNRQEELKRVINSAADNIVNTGKLPAEMKAKINDLIAKSKLDTTAVSSAFTPVREMIDAAVKRSYSSLDNVYNVLMNISGEVPEFGDKFDSASETIKNIKTRITGLKDYIDETKKKIDKLSALLDSTSSGSFIKNIIDPIIKNPTALGDFVSSPVTVQRHSLYPVENYGSAMSPFYSTLAFWVGGIILVAVMKTDLTKRELRQLEKPNSTQLYFGRYLIYFFIGQIQAWIISLGDLFFLKVQCDNPALFILTCLISSFVYTLIIYSLTITFSVIGKASAVIILVIQIAGSGGTFPIEVLPAPFQAVSPYLPFKYGINAIRETVAGADMNAYFHNLGLLLAFVPFALVLGIILRKPCIKVITFFNERVEQSDIIV